MLKHRSITLKQHIFPNLNCVVGPNGKEVLVECGMVKLAQCYAVFDNRLTFRVAVRNNMSSVKQLIVF